MIEKSQEKHGVASRTPVDKQASGQEQEIKMRPFNLVLAAKAIGAEGRRWSNTATVQGIFIDSRHVKPGGLFFALKGERTDGHQYAAQALERGALGAVVERVPQGVNPADERLLVVGSSIEALGRLARWYRDQFDITIVGVTGSTGKTSTKEMIAQALQAAYPGTVLKSQGNYNTEIGVPLTLYGLNEHHRVAVLEMAMRGSGQIDWLCEVANPLVGVVTQIGWSHIEQVGSRRGIAEAKGELLRRLPANGAAVLSRDDRFFPFLESLCRCPVVSFGKHREADVRLIAVEGSTREASRGIVQVGDRRLDVQIPVPGEHQLINVTAALAVASVLGVDLGKATAELAHVRLPEMRMAVQMHQPGWTLINDAYNANPDSMRGAIKTLVEQPCKGRRIAILGDMKELGSYSRRLHRQLGRWLAAQPIDLLVLVGNDVLWTASTAMEGGFFEDRLLYFETPEEAGEWLQLNVREGDCVLLKASRAVELERAVRWSEAS